MNNRRLYTRVALALAVAATFSIAASGRRAYAAAADVVLYASDVTTVKGHWSRESSSSGAGSAKLTSTDGGWSTTDRPLASPSNYFEATFDADANTPYRVWLRLRAGSDSKWNDSVWVQFSNSDDYRIGSSSGLLVNLERCNGCGTSQWGWFNSAYWLDQSSTVTFSSSGTQTIRVQTREDGVQIDQIVLSPATYMSRAPGGVVDDSTIVSKSSRSSASGVSAPVGSAASVPGHVFARDYDGGGEGSGYHDTTRGNNGGEYRSDDVDLEDSTLGGHNVGWTAAGEWLKYTINVNASGNYVVRLRVATTHSNNRVSVAFSRNGFSHTLVVPETGGWQAWRDVEFVATLSGGQQTMTVSFPQGGVNLHRISFASTSASPGTDDISAPGGDDPDDGVANPVPPPPSGGDGGSFRMLTWNIKHGQNKSGSYSLPAQAKFIADQDPDVVALQEVQTWDENQPARYKALLEQYTGARWHLQWAPVNSSSGTEGNVILTRLPVDSSTYFQMHATGDHEAMYSNRSVAQATVRVGGVPVHVFSTHLDWYNTAHRTAQLNDMMDWTQRFGARRIVGGDFNSWWGESWIITMTSEYYDTWVDVTGSKQNGHTVNGAVRFDYLFRSKEGGEDVTPTNVYVPSTSLSDHYPVIADYRVKP